MRLRIASILLAVGALLLVNTGPAMALTLTSSAFEAGGTMPAKYTCEGDDLSPPLAFAGVPAGTKSLALVVDDPDAPDPKAPKRVWVHWVVFNLPADSQGLPENASGAGLPGGAVAGINDWKRNSYGGPCPPIGRHRYFHKLYALDIALPAKPLTKSELEAAMKGHVLAQAELIGTYQKGDR
jgi:Raf kinase inhibitor-like YbhB/YbcL family protein